MERDGNGFLTPSQPARLSHTAGLQSRREMYDTMQGKYIRTR